VHEWPPPPDQPRIRYLGQLAADADLKPARPFGQRLGAALFGRKDVRTMLSPIGVCSDGGGRVFVADSNAQLVHVFDLSTRKYQRWQPPRERGAFSQPVGVGFDPAGRLLVADSVEHAVFAFDREGAFLGVLADSLERPCAVCVEPGTGRVFVADAGAHQVVILSPEGDELRRVGSRGSGPGEFNFPTAVALDSEGCLFVSDSLNFRVQVFGPDLAFVRQIGRKGDMPGSFAQPKGIAIGPEGHLYVVDAHFEAIQVFDPEGTLLMTFGREGRGPGEFWLPVGIHADAQGRVWVADSYNRRVQAFQYLTEVIAP
jgi:DNA-binding beta-propeller fold protein YncE